MSTFVSVGAAARPILAQALRAIKMRGGEVLETRNGDIRHFAAVDEFGGNVAAFEQTAIEELCAIGKLQLARFERGGIVWSLAATARARVAYCDRSSCRWAHRRRSRASQASPAFV
jgi:hypothetical protein